MRTLCIYAFLFAFGYAVAGATPADTTDTAPELPEYDDEIVVVTPTRSPQRPFDAASPVEAFGASVIREAAASSVTDVLRDLPGLDVAGVGANQARPTLRGQRGQRILLLENGLRLDNPRRERNFGELLALVDVDQLERVEIVRGAASVLYGSDAIGGVINLITPRTVPSNFGGKAGYLFSDSGDHHRGHGTVWGRRGDWSGRVAFAARTVDDYTAPSGSFGDITLEKEAVVNDSGGEDFTVDALVSFQPSDTWRAFASYHKYEADTTGFGFVDPAAYGESVEIRIRYPELNFDKFTAGFERTALPWAGLSDVEITGYYQQNQRQLMFQSEFGIGPGAFLNIQDNNETDLTSAGLRAEAKGRLSERVGLVYGLDFVRDDSENTENSVTVITGFGPPMVTENDSTPVPYANQENLGLFAQSAIDVTRDLALIAGARWQRVSSATEETPRNELVPVSRVDQTWVGSLNARYALHKDVALVGTVGRAFRTPNIVERYFDGPISEVGAYQRSNPDLDPETSLNFDLGVRVRNVERGMRLDAFAFHNTLTDGIRIAPTGAMIDGQPEYRNQNVDELRFKGLEFSGETRVWRGFGVAGNYTLLDAEDTNEPSNPIGESFESKAVLSARYRDPGRRFSLGYDVRITGETTTLDLGLNPLGDKIPGFTVHALRAGLNLGAFGAMGQPRLSLLVENLTDELYAEVGNASFFRPSPGRNVTLRWDVGF